ncbi:MAG TPA: hypothetical protein PLD23_13175, partial [Armatimonadota bacterium]|nr:hypothetical protein [Armatimonadota bacterium]
IESTYSQRGPLSLRIYGQVRELDSVFVEGQRKTYFAIKQGCIVRMETRSRGSSRSSRRTSECTPPRLPGRPSPAPRLRSAVVSPRR